MSINGKIDETSPLGIFLVKSGSKGEKLLFRYPYSIDEKKKKEVEKKSGKYAVVMNEDGNEEGSSSGISNANANSDGSGKSSLAAMPPYTEIIPTIPNPKSTPATTIETATAVVIGITDVAFANFFAVNQKLCGEKFELKVNDIRFVGHPMLLLSGGNQNNDKDLLTFNVVFALKANASHDIVDRYHDLSKRIAIALAFEEKRCGYLNVETKSMIALHDEVAHDEENDESPYKLILEKSRLAKDLRKVHEELTSNGTVHIRINRWIEVSFCLPQKVHRLMLKHHQPVPSITPENIQNCLQSLRPYHAALLIVDPQEFLSSLAQDASPAFVRIVRMVNPIKSLIELSADADLTLSQVFHIVAQLVYWAKATVIYPVCESNVYTIHPLAPTHVESPLVEKFADRFPGEESLLVHLSDFSLGLSLSDWTSPHDTSEVKKQKVQMIVWMLQHRLLLQLHKFTYFVPLSCASAYLTEKVSQQFLNERPQSALTMTENGDGMEFSTGSSYPSEDSLATSPPNPPNALALISNSNKSSLQNSDDDLTEAHHLHKSLNGLFNETGIAISSAAILSQIGLQKDEIESILRVAAARNIEDLKLFARLCPYFNGRHHLEDIMYYENVRRGVLLALLDKFRDVLFTCQYEDSAVSELCPYDQRY